jgi:hypothetical protein
MLGFDVIIQLFNYSSFGFGSINVVVFCSFSTKEGTRRAESGVLTPVGYSVTGSWEYLGTDGPVYRTEFVADRNG